MQCLTRPFGGGFAWKAWGPEGVGFRKGEAPTREQAERDCDAAAMALGWALAEDEGPARGGVACCGVHDSALNLSCTRPIGHAGDHVGHGTKEALGRWPQTRLGVTATATTWDCSACGWSGAYEALTPPRVQSDYPSCPDCGKAGSLGTDGGKRPAKPDGKAFDLWECRGHIAVCRACGVVQEGTASATIRHHDACAAYRAHCAAMAARALSEAAKDAIKTTLAIDPGIVSRSKALPETWDRISLGGIKVPVAAITIALSPPLTPAEMVAACDAHRGAFLVGPRDAVVAPKRKAPDPDAKAKRLRSEYGGRWVR